MICSPHPIVDLAPRSELRIRLMLTSGGVPATYMASCLIAVGGTHWQRSAQHQALLSSQHNAHGSA